jgi:hypothetical protein
MEFDSTISHKVYRFITDLKQRNIKEPDYYELRGLVASMVKKNLPSMDYDRTADIVSEWIIIAMRYDMHHYKVEYLSRQIKQDLQKVSESMKIILRPYCSICGKSYRLYFNGCYDADYRYVCPECEKNEPVEIAEPEKPKPGTAEYYREYRKRKKNEAERKAKKGS